MNQPINSSPLVKSDKAYTHSPGFKRQHPYNPENSISLKNSMNQKDFQSVEEMEFYKARCIDLEQYVRQLKNELDTTIMRLSKSGSLDEKVELLLRQNQALSQDLDKLQKNFAQKKTECELWKNKYEQQLNQSVQIKASYELDLRKLSNELKTLEDRNILLERDKSHDLEATKTNLTIQNEQQRHNYLQQVDLLENQLRKFRDYADERDKEVYELENKISRLNQDHEIIENRLLKDIDILRGKLQENDRDSQIEMNNLRQKLDVLNQGQIDNMKSQYLTQIEIMDNEIDKLKGLLDIKNTEIETLIIQNQRLRANYEEEIQTVRMQFDILKEKMQENEQQFQDQTEDIENTLTRRYQEEINQLLSRYKNEISILEQQVDQLQNQNKLQASEISKLLIEKNQSLETFMKEQQHYQSQIAYQNDNTKQLDTQKSLQIQTNLQQYLEQNQQLQDHINKQNEIIEQIHTSLNASNRIIELKDAEIQRLLDEFKAIRTQLFNQLLKVTADYEELRLIHNQSKHDNQRESNQLNQTIQQLQQQVDSATNKIKNDKQLSTSQIDSLKQQLFNAKQQIKQLTSEVDNLNESNKELVESLEQINLDNQHQKQQELNSHQNAINELKAQYDDRINRLVNDQSQLKQELDKQVASSLSEVQLKTQQFNELAEKLLQLESDLQSSMDESDQYQKLISQHKLIADIRLTQQLNF